MTGEPDWTALDPTLARRVLEADLFDAALYRSQAHLGANEDAFAHYCREGLQGGLRANPVFDPAWYVRENPQAGLAGADPLLHYALVGEAAGRDPSPWFDVAWYRRTYGADRPLAHYLARRFGPFSPIPEFDAAYYLDAYPDVGAARLDPFLHYMHFGYREFRKPRADFNPKLYANRWLEGDRGANPVAHLRARKDEAAPPARPGPFTEARANGRPGPRFEAPAARVAGKPGALTLAFHLTQFHRIAENDAWWGEGFTEWTQLQRGAVRFEGHYQPRIPGRLGFYDLSHPDALRAQAALAKAAGVHGFVFYYYDFDGRRLLEKPLEQFLASPDVDIAFCLMWANENWTRRWDGADEDVLIAQSYQEGDEERRCAAFARHFRDPRYVRLDGRPLLMAYRASLIPGAAQTLARWRRLFALKHAENPIFVMAQCFDDVDPRPLGFDGAVEFPPHKLTKGLPQIYDSLEIYDEAFEADAFAYDDLAAASLAEPQPPFPLIKTAVPSWDNDARRQGQGLTLVGASPRKYERWLAELIARAKARPFFGQALVCVNAWNEWSEGAYLEPDVHFGSAYLNATARAVFGAPRRNATLAVVGELADGALGELARRLAAAFGLRVERVADAAAAVATGAVAGLAAAPADVVALAEAGLAAGWRPLSPPRAPDALARASAVIVRAGASGPKLLVEPERNADAAESDRFLRALFERLLPAHAKISVVIRNRNGVATLPAQLQAVFAQTAPLWEIFVLDVGSTDGSLDAVDAAAGAAERDVAFAIENPDATELALWRRAAGLASGDFVWIVEADGLCDPECAELLAAPMRADLSLAMAFCDSRQADLDGRPVAAKPAPFSSAKRVFADKTFAGAAFAERFTLDRAGAALWRRDPLLRALATFGDGDLFDLDQLARRVAALAEARVRYVAEALDVVRAPRPG